VTRRLDGLVSAQAGRCPDAIALVMGAERLTYAELEERSNRLANLLATEGLRPGDRVALFTPKSPLAIVGMLATLKAGAAYVPIDAASPAPRVARVLDACRPRFALVSSGTAAQHSGGQDDLHGGHKLGWSRGSLQRLRGDPGMVCQEYAQRKNRNQAEKGIIRHRRSGSVERDGR